MQSLSTYETKKKERTEVFHIPIRGMRTKENLMENREKEIIKKGRLLVRAISSI
jgi:hypothetical protein